MTRPERVAISTMLAVEACAFFGAVYAYAVTDSTPIRLAIVTALVFVVYATGRLPSATPDRAFDVATEHTMALAIVALILGPGCVYLGDMFGAHFSAVARVTLTVGFALTLVINPPPTEATTDKSHSRKGPE